MSNTGRKFKITYQNKNKKIDAPADYKDFKSKCEQLFSIKYKTNILNAKFYDEEECELIVRNQADYKNSTVRVMTPAEFLTFAKA